MHIKNLKSFPIWLIPLLFSLMLFSLNSLSTSPDSALYLNSALNIIKHEPLTQIYPGVFERRPLYSMFIAFSYWLFGVSIKNAFLVTRIFFLLNVMAVFYFGRIIYNKWVGLIASFLLLTSFAFNEWSSYLLIDNILPFFLLGYFFFLYKAFEKESVKYFLLAGLFLISSLLLKEKAILFLSAPFFLMVFIKDYRRKKVFKSMIALGILLIVIFVSWGLLIYFSSGNIFTPLAIGKNLEHIKIHYSIIFFNNPDLKFIFANKYGNFSPFSFIGHLYSFYNTFVSTNFPLLMEFLLLLGWFFTLYQAFMKRRPDILMSTFLLISIFIMAYVGNPEAHRRFGDILFLLVFSSLVIGRLIYEMIKKILLIFKKIKLLKLIFISPILIILLISSVFGTQISQSWNYFKTRVSLFSGNWNFTVDAWHNDNIKNISTWISENIRAESKIISSAHWGESFYFYTKGNYPLEILQYINNKDIPDYFDREKLLFFNYRENFSGLNFFSISEDLFLQSLKAKSAQYILITPPDNSLLSYLNYNDSFEKLREISMYPNPGRITLYKVLDIKPRVDSQGVINRAMMTRLKNLYQANTNKFEEVKERILKKGLGWSEEDVERRIIQEIPSNFVNLKLNNNVEFSGFDLCPIIQSRFGIIEVDKNKKQNDSFPIKHTESIENKRLVKKIPLLKLGEKFDLIFYWNCLKIIDHRYTIWASLNRGYDSIELSHILIDDSEYPTTEWRPGEVIKDICQFRVPDYIDPGEYEFKISLYDNNEETQITSSLAVGEVNIFLPLEGAIQRARDYNKLGQPAKSLNEYLDIINHINDISNPKNKDTLMQAIRELETYKIRDNQHFDIGLGLGIGYEKLGNLEKAEEMLKSILEKDENHSGALLHLGKIYYLHKKYQLASQILEEIPWNEDNNFESGLILKKIYGRLKNSEKLLEIDKRLRAISENSIKNSEWDINGITSPRPLVPWANANIGKKIILYGDHIKLPLRIRGEKSGSALPHITVWLDNRLLYEGYLKNDEWNDFEFYIKDIEPGQHLLKIWKRGGGPLHFEN